VTQSLSRHYPGVVALEDLTVRIAPGVTGLVGPNGAGKSTLIKILLGLVEPSSGDASVFGRAIGGRARGAHNEIRRLVGYMPEHDCLPPDMSATEFVAWLARCSGFPPSAARERAADVLRHVGLFEERYRPMGGYSTGMAQRAKLAQALVHDPSLLILDEPTNGLDPAGRDVMLSLIARTAREFGISVLVSSHLLAELERICDAVVLLEGGRLTRAASLRSLTGATSTLLVEVDGDATHFSALLAARGLDVRRDGAHVLVTLPGSSDTPARADVFDTIRDVAADAALPLLTMTQRRGQLEDLFRAPAA
jgi:ABC-2 type transport system ATP-binding protein